MKQIVNFFLAGIVLLLAALWFPEYVRISDLKSLVLATFLLFLAEILVVVVIFVIIVAMAIMSNWAGVLSGVISIFFAEIIALSLIDSWLPGVEFSGFWTQVLLAFALSTFRIPSTNNNN